MSQWVEKDKQESDEKTIEEAKRKAEKTAERARIATEIAENKSLIKCAQFKMNVYAKKLK